ncbi:GTPase-activator protein for Ras family GTPase [Entamoeba histolytica HM-1:IMSS-B]|uniref:GTPase-activator protein for Ras family GTPase n=6 Tax=Entamoeba histolytica TaxID=5759 RepID=C4M5H6_ENTH1|nr:hypothetical protein EHI_111200 [Entamoeba histolytica HM-1:IMSS]EMD48985.1 gtpaseactivator protein for Ras family gtpase [Entamoeba histolytica KU27]EMH76735.1 GTPase-activator protein for Ras family GTPase [Entamoeba histolytica HM-1:IMSS-B]EMS13942.1 GTPase-activator protein for Ras family GTPase [Entamoeba histolytica HM-3:IMSS]ENY62584.1 GTPase-activator protein for Ras family GTPase, putative [Entamoeba histolytica HM-1:IMSS-A]GAT96691.1 hypothetical protein CL6EHI_111200 [Entamoeba h|eukprot:XP_657592.1 hypothetical protein EHI_111200 [Entamoeba histolytica HM-1:IMSS]
MAVRTRVISPRIYPKLKLSTSAVNELHDVPFKECQQSTLRSRALLSPRFTDHKSMFSPIQKKSPEQALRSLLFCDTPSLLYCYCDSLLKQTVSLSAINSLLVFYSSRGKVTLLFTKLGEKEINKSKQGIPLFRGNTSFIRLYNAYVITYCNHYLIDMADVIVHETDQPSINEQYQITKWVKSFTKYLVNNLHSICSHHKRIIRELCRYVSPSLDNQKRRQVFTTLFFLRYLFLPLISYPSLLKTLQKAISEWLKQPEKSQRDQNNPMTPFKNAIDIVYDYIINFPDGMDVGMVDQRKQEESLCHLISILKENMHVLSNCYSDDFYDIFSLVKGNQVDIAPTNVAASIDNIKQWNEDKINTMTKINVELKAKIRQMELQNEKIKQQIRRIKSI